MGGGVALELEPARGSGSRGGGVGLERSLRHDSGSTDSRGGRRSCVSVELE